MAIPDSQRYPTFSDQKSERHTQKVIISFYNQGMRIHFRSK